MKELTIPLQVCQLLYGVDGQDGVGVCQNYVRYADRTVRSEGKQGVTRLKAYRAKAIQALSTGDFTTPPGKYRKLQPLLKALHYLLEEQRFDAIGMVLSVLRVYDFYYPTEKQMRIDYDKFCQEFLSDEPQDVSQIPETFPADAFNDYLIKVQATNPNRPLIELVSPVEQALLLSKKGTVRINNRRSIKGKVNGSWLPSIVGAPLEYATYDTDDYELSKMDLLNFGNNVASKFNMKASWPKRTRVNDEFTVKLRRNSYFGNGGYKTRVVGIADYPTQYTLYSTHESLMRALYTMPNDYTRDHAEGFEALLRVSAMPDATAYCYDLTNATDAFPCSVQVAVLFRLMNKPGSMAFNAHTWGNIMTQLGFDGRFYRVGQPMGLCSSWAAFSVSHHTIMSFAYSNIRGKIYTPWSVPKDLYGIVGDDVFITEQKLAIEYAKLMQSLGVKINYNKSLSIDSNHAVGEFVKRNNWRGHEISAVSPNLVVESFSNYSSLRSLLTLLKSRYPEFNTTSYLRRVMKFAERGYLDWIKTNLGIPTRYGGINEFFDSHPLAEPLVVLASILQYSKSCAVYKYIGPYLNRAGQVTVDDVTNWESQVSFEIDQSDSPILSYVRTYGEIRTSKLVSSTEEIAMRLSQHYNDCDDDFDVFYLLLESDVKLQTLIHENECQHWQTKQVSQLVMRDYHHHLNRMRRKINAGERDFFTLLRVNLPQERKAVDYDAFSSLFDALPDDEVTDSTELDSEQALYSRSTSSEVTYEQCAAGAFIQGTLPCTTCPSRYRSGCQYCVLDS